MRSRARRFDKSRNCNPQYNRKGCSIHANSKIHSANLSKKLMSNGTQYFH